MKRTESFHPMTDRYAFDCRHCTVANGWAQVDTRQDASYYGTWTNPFTLKIVTYCEGDITVEEAETPQEYVEAVHKLKAWNEESDRWLGIDGMLNDTIIAEFNKLGLGELLH